MSVTIKAVFEEGSGLEADIRRFQVPADVASSYECLLRKLCDVFPRLTAENVSLYWRDDDNDFIHFSSDDELMIGLSLREKDTFKVYIKIRESSAEMPETNLHHRRVRCDGCEKPIFDIRYKCSVCPDYDLCNACEISAVHTEHVMVKITPPRGGPYGLNMSSPPEYHPWMSRYMRRRDERPAGPDMDAYDNARNEQTEGIDMHVDVESPRKRCHYTFRKHNRERHHRARDHGLHQAPWAPRMGHNSSWWGGPRPYRMYDNTQQIAGWPNMKPDPSSLGQFDTCVNCRWSTWHNIRNDSDNDVGKNMDTVATAATKSSSVNEAPMATDSQQDIPTTAPTQPSAPVHVDSSVTTTTSPVAPAQSLATAAKSHAILGKSPANPPKAPATPTISNATPAKSNACTDANGIHNVNYSVIPLSDTNGWMDVISDEPREKQPTTASTNATPPPSGTELRAETDIEQELQTALTMMEAMGFSNEDGWLSQLLETKHGDIGQVLDAIEPHRVNVHEHYMA